jgi:hypothetical protein
LITDRAESGRDRPATAPRPLCAPGTPRGHRVPWRLAHSARGSLEAPERPGRRPGEAPVAGPGRSPATRQSPSVVDAWGQSITPRSSSNQPPVTELHDEHDQCPSSRLPRGAPTPRSGPATDPATSHRRRLATDAAHIPQRPTPVMPGPRTSLINP